MWLQSEENEVNCGKMMLLASNKAEIVRYKFEVLLQYIVAPPVNPAGFGIIIVFGVSNFFG